MRGAASFWARRRAAVAAEAEADQRAAEAAQDAARATELAAKDDAEVLSELGLPDPADLCAGDDFSAFMAREVPEHLRKRALRQLWRSNPVLACLDGLNDYDDDYRAEALLQEPVKTAYRVGKGMLKHIEEMERQAQVAAADSTADSDFQGDIGEDADTEVSSAATEQKQIAPERASEADASDLALSDPEQLPAPRRMRFHFEEARG